MKLVRECLLGLMVAMLHVTCAPPVQAGIEYLDQEGYSLGPDGACWLTVAGQQTCTLSWVARPDVLERTWTITSGCVRSLAGTYIGKTSVGDWIIVKVAETEIGKIGGGAFKKLARQCLSQNDISYLELATRRAADGTPTLPFDGVTVAPLPSGQPAPKWEDSKPVKEPLPKWAEFTPDVPAGLPEAERENWTQAAQGNAQAQAHVGWMYANGERVPQNYVKAREWYRKAAEQGNAVAQNNLVCLLNDYFSGPPEVAAEAEQWWRKAAEQGNASAKQSLASLSAKEKAPPAPDNNDPWAMAYVVTSGAIAVAVLLFFASRRAIRQSKLNCKQPTTPQPTGATGATRPVNIPPEPLNATVAASGGLQAGQHPVSAPGGQLKVRMAPVPTIPPGNGIPPSLQDQEKWFYAVGAGREGPVSRESLLALRAAGELGDETLVWTRGLADWKPFKEAVNGSSQPMPPTAVATPATPSTGVPRGAASNAGPASPVTMPTKLPPQQRSGQGGTGIKSILNRLPPVVRNYIVSLVWMGIAFGAINLLLFGGQKIWHYNDQEKLDTLNPQIELMKSDLRSQEAQLRSLDTQISRCQAVIDRSRPTVQWYENTYPDGIPQNEYVQYCREVSEFNEWIDNKNTLVAQYNAIYPDYARRVDRFNAAITEANATAKRIGGTWYVIPIPLPAVGGHQPTQVRQRAKAR